MLQNLSNVLNFIVLLLLPENRGVLACCSQTNVTQKTISIALITFCTQTTLWRHK